MTVKRTAQELFAQWKPDLVLMDITMPNKTGIEALEEITGSDPGARVIMCSAVGQEPMIKKALDLGALILLSSLLRRMNFGRCWTIIYRREGYFA